MKCIGKAGSSILPGPLRFRFRRRDLRLGKPLRLRCRLRLGRPASRISGAVTHTAEYRPWRIKSYVAFSSVSGTGLINLVRMARLLWGLAALVRGL
jgi:hypothetical protein